MQNDTQRGTPVYFCNHFDTASSHKMKLASAALVLFNACLWKFLGQFLLVGYDIEMLISPCWIRYHLINSTEDQKHCRKCCRSGAIKNLTQQTISHWALWQACQKGSWVLRPSILGTLSNLLQSHIARTLNSFGPVSGKTLRNRITNKNLCGLMIWVALIFSECTIFFPGSAHI